MSSKRIEELEEALSDALEIARELNSYAKEIACDNEDDESAEYCECTDEQIERLSNVLEKSS